ncbi:alanine racemase C-terminal domain-containing protein (plasmid) [Coraliomargarita sp. W4R53]
MRISRGALLHNAREAFSEGFRTFASDVLAADAWGHGRELVQGVLDEAGFTPAQDGDLDALRLLGLPGGADTAIPAMTLAGTVLGVKALQRGEGVSYGYLFRAASDTRIALVTGGYAQGIARSLGGHVAVSIQARSHPIVGRVAMDVCVADVGNADINRGDEVIFFGDPAHGAPSLSRWIATSGLTAGEIVTMIGLRATREETS